MRRPRPSIRWHECWQMAAILTIAIAALATLVTRHRIAAIPEIGRATPIEELRAAWAEEDEEQRLAESSRDQVTMPAPQPERRP